MRGDDPARALELVRQALRRWRGAAYADVADRPWASLEIARLNELRASAIELEIEALVHDGALDEAIAAAEAAVHDEPLREQRWANLMIALARRGRQAEALAAYGRLRAHLADELGIDPSPSLRNLEAGILQQRPDLAPDGPHGTSAVAPAATSLAPPQMLPAQADKGRREALLAAARTSFGHHDFPEATARFAQAAAEGKMDLDDLEAFADAAMYCGEHDTSIDARQQAFTRALRDGDHGRAAQNAIWLVINHVVRLRMTVAAGWFHRARRLLAETPDSVEQGYLAMIEVLFALATGDLEAGLTAARSTFEQGDRFADPDLEAMGLMLEGVVLMRLGNSDAGAARLDEAMAMASSGGLGPFATGLIYCRTMSACIDVGDYRRATDWLDALTPDVEGIAMEGFPGDCRTHRARLLLIRGSWDEAESEARHACVECEAFDLLHIGQATRDLGLLLLRRGQLDEAAASFDRARSLGVPPEPGWSLLRLERGETTPAFESLSAALSGTVEPLARTQLLPALVEIALAAGEFDEARRAQRELEEHAERFATPAHLAAAATGRARLAGAVADENLIARWRDAVGLWRDVGAPYEHATALLGLAQALAASGDGGAAIATAEQAAAGFEALGAKPARDRATALIEATHD
ncbi:MAG: BTAD domain-containing putative transcriptional regulator [Nitriliruptorales bacterium]|nr:BTAD domain-containing putative transcriptional regulator [Nitriliruptorales bacterium]